MSVMKGIYWAEEIKGHRKADTARTVVVVDGGDSNRSVQVLLLFLFVPDITGLIKCSALKEKKMMTQVPLVGL